MNQNNVEIGGYSLGQQVERDPALTEISAREYAALPKTFMAEQILKAPDATFLGLRWILVIGNIDGRIYKLSAQFVAASDDEADAAFTKAAHFCAERFGASSKSVTGMGSQWNTTFGNAIVDRQNAFGMHCVNLHCTSGSLIRSAKPIDGDPGRAHDRVDQVVAEERVRQAETMARIGRRIKEADEMQPGASYSPPSGNLVFAAIFFLALTFLGGLLVFNTHLWLALKIVTGLLAVFWLLAAGAALRRVWYRRFHGCDR